MYIFVYIITYSILVNADVDKVISEEQLDSYRGHKIKRAGKSTTEIPRRFLDDLSDYEWHISHLRDTDFASGRRHCKETFEDKVKKYKMMLANDASRIEFVSADAIPVDEKDLIPEKCEEVEDSPGKVFRSDKSQGRIKETKKEETLDLQNTATTSKDEKVKTKQDDKGRRASEYQFSSVEYYDEVPDFDEKVCPDAVEVITLQIDALKPYDVECELMLEWQSLE